MDIFQQYAAQQLSPSMEADVNINIDVNEGARTMAPVDTSTVVEAPAIEPALEPATDPLEGTSPEAPAVDPIASEQTEDVTSEVPQVAESTEPAATIDGEAQSEVDAADTPVAEEATTEEGEGTDETAAEEGEAVAVAEVGDGEPSDEEVEQALEDDADEAEDKAETMEDIKSSLESVYQTIASMESAGVTFDEGHAALTAIALNTTLARIGGNVSSIAPSLESDNYFERTDVVASMESIGAAIGAAGKAALAAIIKAIRTAIAYVKNKFSKLGTLKSRFAEARAIAKKMPKDKKVEVKFAAPSEGMTVFQALEAWEKYVRAVETSGRDLVKLNQFFQDNPMKFTNETISVSQAGARELERMFSLAEDMVTRIERTDIVKQLESLEKAYDALADDLDKTPTKTMLTAKDVSNIRFAIGAMITFLEGFKVGSAA